MSEDLTDTERLDPIQRLTLLVEALGTRLERFEEKVDALGARIEQIEVTLAARSKETRPMSERIDLILAELVEFKSETHDALDGIEGTIAGFQEQTLRRQRRLEERTARLEGKPLP
jgi:chromosome segregation ATPase